MSSLTASLPFPRAAERPVVNLWIIAVTVTIATFMELLDTAIANVSLPRIADSIAVSCDESTWMLSLPGEAVCREVLKRGSEGRAFRIPQNEPAALETAVIAVWSLARGLTMLYIDGLATLETAQTIGGLAEKVVAILMYGLVKGEK